MEINLAKALQAVRDKPNEYAAVSRGRLRELLAAASKGKWRLCHHWTVDHCGCGEHPGYIYCTEGEYVIAQMGCQGEPPEPTGGQDQMRADARALVAAVNIAPSLLDEIDRLRELLKSGFAYVRDANRLLAADGDLDEDDEDGANEWLVSAAAALT